jgi:hypothetical protein
VWIIIKMDFKKVLRAEEVYWTHLAQHTAEMWALVNTSINLPAPQRAGNVLTS